MLNFLTLDPANLRPGVPDTSGGNSG